MADKIADKRPRSDRPAFDEMARSVHASYLSRWNRHDPRALEGPARDGNREQRVQKITAA